VKASLRVGRERELQHRAARFILYAPCMITARNCTQKLLRIYLKITVGAVITVVGGGHSSTGGELAHIMRRVMRARKAVRPDQAVGPVACVRA
jgi:hypothetical protein